MEDKKTQLIVRNSKEMVTQSDVDRLVVEILADAIRRYKRKKLKPGLT